MRRTLVVGMMLAACAACPTYAQDAEARLDDLEDAQGDRTLRPTLQTSGLDEDDDLLNPDLDGAPTPPAAQLAPEILAKVATASSELARLATSTASELSELTTLLKQDRANGQAELERRLAATESLEGRVGEVDAELEGAKKVRGTYGDPLSIRRLPRRPVRNVGFKGGPDQYRWWQSQMVKVLMTIHPDVRELAVRRVSELKLRGDTLSLNLEAASRPAADAAVRRAIEGTPLGRGFDARLDQLLLANGRGPQGTAPGNNTEPSTQSQQGRAEFDLNEPRGPLILLPRVRDPLTGRVHVVVNQPLGGPLPTHMRAPN